MEQQQLPDLRDLHAEALLNGYESSGFARDQPPTFSYTGSQLYQVEWIQMNKLGCSDGGRQHFNNPRLKDTFKAGTYALVNVTTKEGSGKGDAYARSIVKILGIYEDQTGCCYVAVHYFWRWGQIHASYDRHPATRPASPHQIFLQKEILKKPVYSSNGKEFSQTPVRYENGKYVELISAVNLEMPVKVLHRGEAEQLPGGLQQYQLEHGRHTRHWDEKSDTPNDGFWFDCTFDHSAYLFEECDKDGLAIPGNKLKRIPQKELTLLDAFCGCGAVSVAANTAGITVVGGIDMDVDAISSYTANTMTNSHGAFNKSGLEPLPLHMPVQDFVKQVQSGDLQLQPIKVLHASPPCQNVSRKKKVVDREITGIETLAIAEMVELLQPVYVTLEEVPGYVVQSFQPENMQGSLHGWPDPSAYIADITDLATASNRQEDDDSAADPNNADTISYDEYEEEQDDDEEVEDDGQGEGGDNGEIGEGDVSATEPDAPPTTAKSAKEAAKPAKGVAFSSLAMLVSKLVGMQYSIEIGILQAVDYQVPQQRERLVILASKHGYHQAHLPEATCWRPPGYRQQPLPATDPNLCIRDNDAAEWRTTLEHSPDDDALLQPHVTIAEAIGDLPPLLGSPPHGDKPLGRAVTVYDPSAAGGAVFRHPVPVNELDGCGPVSAYSVYMRNLHTPQQWVRLGNVFNHRELRGHTCKYTETEIQKLLVIPENRPKRGQTAETEEERKARLRAGRRLAGDAVASCIMSHNEPRKQCLHFLEDRMSTALERRRLQSLPDWLLVEGDQKARERQIGNAVPYLLGVAIMGQVFAAATGQPPYRPPALLGPCLDGTGVPDNALELYADWLQQVEAAEDDSEGAEGDMHPLQECRHLLSAKAASIREQQHQHHHLLRQSALQEGSEQQQQHQQQPQVQQSRSSEVDKQQRPGSSSQTGSQQSQRKRSQQPSLPPPCKRLKRTPLQAVSSASQPAGGPALPPAKVVAIA